MELGATARLQVAQVNACGREVAERTQPMGTPDRNAPNNDLEASSYPQAAPRLA